MALDITHKKGKRLRRHRIEMDAARPMKRSARFP